jgi:AraC family ethanolamine operon transcriptional activator
LTSDVIASDSVEGFAQATSRIWNIEFIQLAASRFRYRARFIATPRVAVYRERCNTPLHIRGELAPDLVAFLLPTDASLPCRLWGRDSVRGMHLPFQRFSGELDAVLDATYGNTVQAFGADFLDETARRCGYAFEVWEMPLGGFLVADPQQSRRLRRLVSRALTADPERSAEWWPSVGLLEDELAGTLLAVVSPPRLAGETAATPSRRAQVVRDCIEYARELDFKVSILELCSTRKIARRTLEVAFGEHLGVSPARYLRLCRYRHALSVLDCTEAGQSTVAKAALAAGFSELGRFAVEYRRLFGEKPSETLRRPPTDVPRIPGPAAAAT